jgi:hypothetical protein
VSRPGGGAEFLTLHVRAASLVGRTRTLLIDAGGAGRLESIPANQVDQAVDLMTSERIDDVWNWLTSGALPPSVIVVPPTGAQARSA